MKKKTILLFSVILFIILIGLIYIFKNKKVYNIEDSVKMINFETKNELNQYYEYIKKYLKPKKLEKFVDFNKLYIKDYNENANGYTVLEQMKYYAYTKMFTQMFDKNRINYDDCPVTDKFIKKFNTNLFYYFKLKDVDDSSVKCGINRKEFTLNVEEAGNFEVGEPGYVFYHHFHYTLDEEGKVDDVIFDYTE